VNLSSLVANIDGHQRKIVMSEVRPARAADGDSGIPLGSGRSLPFLVTRAWNAPAGHYTEAWYIVDPASREVLHEGPKKEVSIWGLQSWTEFTDEVTDPVTLSAGKLLIVFALGGVQGGELEVEATETAAASA
jgi:hypothetical protein